MANTKATGDSGATSSTETAGSNATPKSKDSAKAETEAFQSVEMTRERDGQTRTAHTLADKVKHEFDGFRASSK